MGAEVRTRRTANHQERLLLADLLPSKPPVLRLAKVPGPSAGVQPQVKGGSSNQWHVRQTAQLRCSPGTAVQLGHLRSSVPSADAMDQQHRVDAVGLSGSLPIRDPGHPFSSQRAHEVRIAVPLDVHFLSRPDPARDAMGLRKILGMFTSKRS